MELVASNILAYMLVLTRVSTFFVTMPIFNWPAIPTFIKLSMAMILTVFFTSVTPIPAGLPTNNIEAAILILNEAIYGFALGLAATMLFSVIKLAGNIIEQEMGLNMSEILDPITGEQAQAVSVFLEMVFILLLFSSNIHHLLLGALAKSYHTFPIGSTADITRLLTGLIAAGSEMLTVALQLSAPILAASMVLMIVLAIASKIMPDMDILFISLPFKIGLGLLALAFFLPYMQTYVSQFANLLNRLLPV
jgi:flagellar biosynthetic protein FliR